MDDILGVVRNVIASELEIPLDSIRDEASLRNEYGLDSVAAVNIVFGLETELDVEIDIAEIAHVDSINDIKRLFAEGRLPGRTIDS